MLTLKNVTKSYGEGDNEVKALKGISISFRPCEFVSILGQSGCGKTTLLNVIGGLDEASSGELKLNGVSTAGFNDNDWDDYRNSKIGFVFQSYNLIPHLNILTNVELALTISGVSGAERTERAKNALARVGLSHKWNKRPNELSGGQMQRVAIARAIVNEPDILLADEPTGAIDSETSVQVMEILKEISATKLVIMVTHNAELAEEYSTRIVRFLDGEIVDDTDPYNVIDEVEEAPVKTTHKKKKKHKKGSTMSFFTAMHLSWRNLINKKGRSVLTAIAGSIGIISIALILALNNGFSLYIGEFEKQSMSKYPITVSSGEGSVVSVFEEFLGGDALDGDSLNISSMLDVFTGEDTDREPFTEEELIYIYGQFSNLFSAMSEKLTKTTEISKFKSHLEENFDYSLANVKYDYSVNMNIYNKTLTKKADSEEIIEKYNLMNPLSESSAMSPLIAALVGSGDEAVIEGVKTALDTFAFWDEIIADTDTINAQYDVLAGHLPTNMNEIVIVLDKYNQISDFDALALNELGLVDLISAFADPAFLNEKNIDFDHFLGKEYYILPTSKTYVFDKMHTDGTTKIYKNLRDTSNPLYETQRTEALKNDSVPVKISGILRTKEGIEGGCINGVVGYSSLLGEYIIKDANESEFALDLAERLRVSTENFNAMMEVMEKKSKDPSYSYTPQDLLTIAKGSEGMKNPFNPEEKMSTDERSNLLKSANVRDWNEPNYIYIYPNRIADKQAIVSFIDDFIVTQTAEEERLEAEAEANGTDKPTVTYVIEYEDNLDSVVSELNSVVDTITYILVAVACVSVIVTMLLIAIIMYISVQDRTREIGIMRAIGARKRDISNIFNVETMLLGFASGIIGVLLSFLIQFPGNLVFKYAMNMSGLLVMAWWHPLVLIGGAVVITTISGLIPASIASRKNPVIALRTE